MKLLTAIVISEALADLALWKKGAIPAASRQNVFIVRNCTIAQLRIAHEHALAYNANSPEHMLGLCSPEFIIELKALADSCDV